jgi:hypothetical protein
MADMTVTIPLPFFFKKSELKKNHRRIIPVKTGQCAVISFKGTDVERYCEDARRWMTDGVGSQ